MQTKFLRKGIIIGIILLFVGTSIVTGVNGTVKIISHNNARNLNCDILTFYPTDDAFIKPETPNGNHGTCDYMHVRNDYGSSGSSGWASDILIRFDISSVPSNANIISAVLTLYYYQYYDNNPAGRDLNLYRATSDWDEDTVTWNAQPSYAAQQTTYSPVPSSTSVRMEWDVTNDVEDFTSGSYVNYGWKVTDENYWGQAGIPKTFFRAGEYGGDYIPYLKIEINEAPSPPLITGPTNGKAGTGYEYTFIGFDPEDNDVYHWIEWGDDSVIEWFGPYESGDQITISHTWLINGTYIIKAKTKDSYDLESEWATLEVSMPKNKIINSFERFLDNHPRMFPMLKQLLGL